MTRRLLIVGAAILGVAFAAPVFASQKGINGCTKATSDKMIDTTKAIAKVFTKCAKAVEGCLAKDVGDQPGCLAGITAAGKACGDDTLNDANANGKVGKPLSKALISIDKKCNPATVGDTTKIDLGTGVTNGTSTGLLGDTNFNALGANVGGRQFCNLDPGQPFTYANYQACIRAAIIRDVIVIIIDKHPRIHWLLRLAGVSALRNIVPIGKHHVTAATSATLNTYLGPVPLTGITGNFDLNVTRIESATGTADISVPAATSSFTSVFIPIAGGITVCVGTPKDGSGKLCCQANCTATMGSPNYSVNQDHDSSGNNTAFGLLPGEVGPADPTCVASVTNTIGGASDVNSACREDKARGGACNADAIGSANPNSHAPRCLGGGRNGRFCDPAFAGDCPGGAGCPGGGGCCSQSPAVGPILSPPCNGPATVIPAAGTSVDGAIILGLTIQFTLHSHTLDAVNYGGGCANIAADGKPDGWGCDGIACNADDTTAPQDPAQLAATVGTTSATVFDANTIPTGFGGTVTSGSLTGAFPLNACHRISASVTTGYSVVAAFPGLDNSQLGDTSTSVTQVW